MSWDGALNEAKMLVYANNAPPATTKERGKGSG